MDKTEGTLGKQKWGSHVSDPRGNLPSHQASVASDEVMAVFGVDF